jgi:putative DNA primase/helicase
VGKELKANGRSSVTKGRARALIKANGSDIVTEDGAALAFADLHVRDLRYDHNAGCWFGWDGSLWRRDETQVAKWWARELARRLAETQPAGLRYVTNKMAFANAVERGAACDQRLAVTQAVWDTDAYLLGTPEGTVDLRTGVRRNSERDDMITRATAVAPQKMPIPRWNRFLREATREDEDLIRFLQVVCGYALTGETSEDLLIFVYGPGGNGKGTFLYTVGGIFGDYATAAAMDTFTASHHERHPVDMALLKGARLVTVAEVTQGKTWDETRVKQFTGGDPITARFMRQNFFTYMPEFQLIITGNHQPRLINIGDAMRRRLAMVPFMFAPKVKDVELKQKLRVEWSGILWWMIQGCLWWQRHKGIKRPDVVRELTDEYFREQDLLGQWVEERVERTRKQSDRVLRSDAFRSWQRFAEAAAEDPMNEKWFCSSMRERGFAEKRTENGRFFTHTRLIGRK